MIVTDKLSTESFHAFIDEQLTDEQYVQVEAQLDAIPEKIEEIQQCHIVNERLREVFDSVVEEPLPEDLYELAIYGLDRQANIEDYDDQEDTPISYLELEDDLAAIDSLDIFSEEEVGDESLVDDTDVSDLEVLAQTEHLSDFDIDDLKNDSSNILPDIFDVSDDLPDETDAEIEATAEASQQPDPTDGLLESIDELSLELEKAQQSKQVESDTIALPAEDDAEQEKLDQVAVEDTSAEYGTESLEFALGEEDMLDSDQYNEQYEEPLPEVEDTLAAREEVLETLASEEELTLEPLDDSSDAAFIQQSETQEVEQQFSQSDNQQKASRPRNLREDLEPVRFSSGPSEQAEVQDDQFYPGLPDTEEQIQQSAIPADDNPVTENIEFSAQNEFEMSGNKSGLKPEEAVPVDLVAEFFDENKRADFEVNEVVKQFEEVSQNFDVPAEGGDHLFDDGPFAGLKYQLHQFIESAKAKVEYYESIFNQKKSQLLGKFGGGGSSIDFNRSPFEDSALLEAPKSPSVDTLDLSAFDDINKEPIKSKEKPDNEFIEGSPQVVQPGSGIENVFGTESNEPNVSQADTKSNDQTAVYDGSRDFSDLSNAPAAEFEHAEIVQHYDDEITNSHKVTGSRNEQASEFDFDLDVGGEETNGNLVSKFGDTLKRYKQKIAEMRANQAEVDEVEDASVFGNYKNTASTVLSNLSAGNDPKILAGAALIIGVVVVSFVLYLSGGSSDTISNERIDKLAIDTHLLNTQFNSKIVADADSAIIEKLQWFSARVGHPVRLADIRVEDFEFKKVSVLPTMTSFAAANIFENKAGQRITLLAIPDVESTSQSQLFCRIPAEVDGLCVWVKDSVRYIAVANLSLSRVRSFSEQIIEKL